MFMFTCSFVWRVVQFIKIETTAVLALGKEALIRRFASGETRTRLTEFGRVMGAIKGTHFHV